MIDRLFNSPLALSLVVVAIALIVIALIVYYLFLNRKVKILLAQQRAASEAKRQDIEEAKGFAGKVFADKEQEAKLQEETKAKVDTSIDEKIKFFQSNNIGIKKNPKKDK